MIDPKVMLDILLAVLGFCAMALFKRVSDDIRFVSRSIGELNIKMAVTVSKVEEHGDRIGKLEDGSQTR